ncbi:hypothetical protein QU41_00005, partial [Bradyrhizobium elkanii]
EWGDGGSGGPGMGPGRGAHRVGAEDQQRGAAIDAADRKDRGLGQMWVGVGGGGGTVLQRGVECEGGST